MAADPDVPRAKITAKLREIRDERDGLRSKLAVTEAQLDRGRQLVRTVLDYLEQPQELYGRSGIQDRIALNRLILKKIYLDIDEEDAVVVTERRGG